MPIKLGIIGCGGNMRQSHLPRIAKARGVKLVAACDPIANAVDQVSVSWGKPLGHYADYRKMLANEDLDAVVISTPHNQHAPQARAALRRGLHVLVEKPLTIRAADAKSLITLARREKRVLHVSYQRNHMAPYAHIRKLIATGRLGRLRAAIGYVTQAWAGVRGWRLDPEQAGGGMFMDTGSHLVSTILFLTGLKVREVSAVVDKYDQAVDINTVVAVRFNHGVVGSISTIGNARLHDERITIHGDDGSIVIHQHGWKLRSVLHNDRPLKVPSSVKDEYPDAAFFRWIRGGKDYTAPDYAVQVARISEAVYKSAAQRKSVRLRNAV